LGESPAESREATARLQLLLDVDHRSRLAAALRNLLERARQPRRYRLDPAVPIRRSEILRSEPLILSLADELEELEDVNPRGVILASRLVHDGRSPVYWRRSEMELDRAVRHARTALHLD
jgi:hypothetical protein